MNTEVIRSAIENILSGKSSLYAAAKAIGRPSSNLRYWIMKNPEYAAAYEALQEANPDRLPLNLERLSVEELASHPAVLAIVNDGMTYAKASEKFGVRVMTLHGWIKKLYPGGIGRKRGRRGSERNAEEVAAAEEHTTTTAILSVAHAAIQAAATATGLTYHQVLAKLLEQAPTSPEQSNKPLR